MRELVIDANVENLNEVLALINEELAKKNCDKKFINKVNIAAEEVFVNIANYAYYPKEGTAVIRVDVCDEVIIEFEDEGIPYNPLDKEEPDITKSAEQRPIGGLGVFMVKKIMDDVSYRYSRNKNILTIKKSIN